MVRQNLVLPYLSQKWYGSCRACHTGGAAHGVTGPRKKFDNILSRLDTIHERTRSCIVYVTDGLTDGHRPTAKTALTHGVAR